MTSSFKPSQTGNSRVFLIEGQARPDHEPDYKSHFKAGAIEQDTGESTRIEVPDPDRYGEFIEVGEIQGAVGRPTLTLTGRYAQDLASDMLRLAKARCAFDIQVHLGSCTDPRDFDQFSKVVILERAKGNNWSTEDLGALSSDEAAKVDETLNTSGREVYEFMPLNYVSKAGDVITNEVVDVVICDRASCGDCDDESTGCSKIFAVTLAAGGSPSTPADVVFSLDKGLTWYAHDVEAFGASDDGSGLACLGTYLVVVSNDFGGLAYATLTEFDGTTDPEFTGVTTGFNASGAPNDIWSVGNFAFVVGNGGYIYTMSEPTGGATVLDAGVAVSDNLNAVHALSKDFAVAVGNASSIVKIDGLSAEEIAPPTGVEVNYNCVWVKSESEWFIGTSNGKLYYTLDGGQSWSEKTFPGSGSGVVRDIQFAKDSVAYLSHSTSGSVGRILESVSGGNNWIVAPRNPGTLPANDRVTALAACPDDVNFVVGVGLADDGSDGYIVIGQD